MSLTPNQPQIPDILRWVPRNWDQIVGNRTMKRFFMTQVQNLRRRTIAGEVPNDLNQLCLLLAGASRSGKTSIVKKFVVSLVCREYDEKTGSTCGGRCAVCLEMGKKIGLEGFQTYNLTPEGAAPVHLIMADATKFRTESELERFIIGLQFNEGVRIIFMDEVHRLAIKSMENMLLTAVEDRASMWIFATAKPEVLDDMFLNRLLKYETELPDPEVLGDFLVDRCIEWGINFDPEAIIRTVDKSNCVTGIALHALALASLNPKEGLTLDLVENQWQVKIGE